MKEKVDALHARIFEVLNSEPPAGADPDKVKYPEGFGEWSEEKKQEWSEGMARAVYMAQCAHNEDNQKKVKNLLRSFADEFNLYVPHYLEGWTPGISEQGELSCWRRKVAGSVIPAIISLEVGSDDVKLWKAHLTGGAWVSSWCLADVVKVMNAHVDTGITSSEKEVEAEQ